MPADRREVFRNANGTRTRQLAASADAAAVQNFKRDHLIRAAFFLSDLDAGGAQRTIINVLNALAADRIIPTLIVGRGDGPARAWINASQPLINIGCARTRYALWGLRALIARERFDVLLSTMVDANIVASLAVRLTKRRPGLILRETNSHRTRQDLGLFRRSAVGWAYPSADAVVALSHGVADELVQDYALDPARVVTIYNPIDCESWARRAEAARQSPAPWVDLVAGGPVLVSVGRLTRQKGFDLLLRALAQCQGEGRRAHLVIVGDGPLRAELKALASELGLSDRVFMPGLVADPAPWYAHGDLFVLPSRWEGFGNVLVEAMACGLPVIASACPYGPAEILGDGQGGALVAPNDIEALAQAIDRLLAAPDERARLSLAGRLSVNRFALEHIAAQYANLIEGVAANPA